MPEDEVSATAAPSAALLERESELQSLAELVESVRLGEGRVVVIEGSAGIGKTRLIAAARELSRAADLTVLAARGGELEGDFAFGIVRQLFEAHVAAASPAVRRDLFAGAAQLSSALFASAPEAVRERQESPFAVLHGLYWLAANFASLSPTLLVVDDLHWADESSLRWLLYIARRLDGLPLGVLVGTRPPAQAELTPLIAELLSDATAFVVRPRALGRDSAAELARSRLGVDPDPAFVMALEEGSGGNPLYLAALIDAVARQGLAPTSAHAPHVLALGPRAVSYGVSTRLARLPPEAAELLRAAAVLGDNAELSVAAALGDLDIKAALDAAAALVRAELLRREMPIEFMHPVVRTAVLEDMSAAARVAAHRRAAELLVEAGSPPEQAAGHLLQTVADRQPFVVDILRKAAGRSRAQGAPEAAATYLLRALAEPPEDNELVDVLHELGATQLSADASAASIHLQRAVDALDDPATRPDIVLAYAHALIATDRPDAATAILQTTSDRIRSVDRDKHLRLEARLVVGTQFEPALHQLRTERLEGASADKLTEGIGAGLVLAQWAHEEARRGVSRSRVIDYARRAQDLGALSEIDELLFAMNALYALALAGEVDAALAALTTAITDAQRQGDLLNLALSHLVRGIVRCEHGDLLGAEEDLRVGEFLDWPGLEAERVAYLCDVLLERAEMVEATALADRPLAIGAPGFTLHFRQARGRVRLEAGRAEEALTDFREVGAIAESLGIANPAYVPWRSQAALALYRLDRRAEARELAIAEIALARAWGAPRTVGIALRSLALVEDDPPRTELLREAAAVLTDSPAPLECARVLVDLGAALRRGNSRSEAREYLREGGQVARRCGATAIVVRADAELAATGAHPRTVMLSGLDSMTASERRVAQMASEERSNKEIAQTLFVTVKTVEQHLSRVYRKLDISSRRQLAGALGVAEAVPPT